VNKNTTEQKKYVQPIFYQSIIFQRDRLIKIYDKKEACLKRGTISFSIYIIIMHAYLPKTLFF